MSGRGAPKGAAIPWSDPELSIGGADAAIDAAGEQGLAVWRQPDPDDDEKFDLVVRPFDARTAQPAAEATVVEPILSFFGVEAYRDGYAIVYERKGESEAEQVIRFLDAQGAPDGEARVLHTGGESFFVDMHRSRSASRLAVMTRGPYGNTGIAVDLFRPDGKSIRKRINMRDDSLFDIAHASGAAFMTLWKAEAGDRYVRRLDGKGELGRVRPVAAKAGKAFAIAFNADRGVVVNQTSRCTFDAIEVTPAGKTGGSAHTAAQDCGPRTPDLGSIFLEPGAPDRFGLAFTASKRERNPALFAAGVRLR